MNAKLWALACVFALVVVPAWATTARELSNQDLAVEADVVVIGKCVSIRTSWVDRMLVTVATVEVTEQLRGGGSAVTVVLPGGVDANRRIPIGMMFPGAPLIAPDEDVFLFLEDERATLGGYTVVGFSQGKFSVMTDVQGQKVVSRDLTKINLQSGTGLARGTRTLTPLAEFKDEIKKHLANR